MRLAWCLALVAVAGFAVAARDEGMVRPANTSVLDSSEARYRQLYLRLPLRYEDRSYALLATILKAEHRFVHERVRA